MKRVCLMLDAGRAHAVIIGEQFRPEKEDTRILQGAGRLKGIKTVTVGNTTGPFAEEGKLPMSVARWAATYADKVDAAAVVWEIVDLDTLRRARPVRPPVAAPGPRTGRKRGKVYVRDPKKVLHEFAPDAPTQVEVDPDLEWILSQLPDLYGQIAYLEPFFFHPDAVVRARAARLCVPVGATQFDSYLVHLLGDPEPTVAGAAAKALWGRQGGSHCALAVRALRDEFGTEGALALGPTGARAALKELAAAAPDATARDALVGVVAKEMPPDVAAASIG